MSNLFFCIPHRSYEFDHSSLSSPFNANIKHNTGSGMEFKHWRPWTLWVENVVFEVISLHIQIKLKIPNRCTSLASLLVREHYILFFTTVIHKNILVVTYCIVHIQLWKGMFTNFYTIPFLPEEGLNKTDSTIMRIPGLWLLEPI